MKTIKISVLLSIVAIFVSCDCFQLVQGIVIDSKTQLPLENVKVEVAKQPHIVIHTDSLGNFKFLSQIVGVFGCPQVLVSFKKEGYNEVTKKYRSWTDKSIVVLEKQAK